MNTSDIQEKIEKLQREKSATEALLKDYPASLPQIDSLCWQNSSLCQFSVTHKVKTLEEAVGKVASWWDYILPLNFSKGTFTTFRTEHHEPERGEKESFSVFPVTVKVSQYNLTFEFYALVNNHLLSVDVEFEFRAGFQKYASVTWKNHHNNYGDKWVTDVTLHTPAFVGYKYIKWVSGGNEYPNSFTLYWDNSVYLNDIFSNQDMFNEVQS